MVYSVCLQVVIVNGYGQLHDRLCGSASQLGLQSGYATIGVAKSLLHSSQLQLDAELDVWCHTSQPAETTASCVQQHPPLGSTGQQVTESLVQQTDSSLSGSITNYDGTQRPDANATHTTCTVEDLHRRLVYPLHSPAGIELGAAVKAGPHSCRPVFVSVGHRVSLATAIAITQACCRYR